MVHITLLNDPRTRRRLDRRPHLVEQVQGGLLVAAWRRGHVQAADQMVTACASGPGSVPRRVASEGRAKGSRRARRERKRGFTLSRRPPCGPGPGTRAAGPPAGRGVDGGHELDLVDRGAGAPPPRRCRRPRAAGRLHHHQALGPGRRRRGRPPDRTGASGSTDSAPAGGRGCCYRRRDRHHLHPVGGHPLLVAAESCAGVGPTC